VNDGVLSLDRESERQEEERRVIPMASNAAAPFWRAAGMTYITYSNICANLVRNCLKEPYKTEALSREKVHFAVTKFVDGNPQKPGKILLFPFLSNSLLV
jgi:F-type H+-transporting ATPase subunit epsilon